MVEINNQRKAFLDMLAWSEGTDNGRQENQKSWLWRHCRRRAPFTDYSDHPRKLVTLKPKTQINRRWRYQLLPAGGMLYQKQLGLERLLSGKSQDAVALQQIKERGALPMIDRWYPLWQSTVAAISGAYRCRALVMVSSSTRLASLIAKFKEAWAERSERLMYEQSHRDYLRSGYLHHRLPVMGC